MPRKLGERLPFDVEKELDEVIGRFEDRRGTRLARAGRIVARVLLAASLALAAALVVMTVLDVHIVRAKTEAAKAAPKKPVPVQIVPGAK